MDISLAGSALAYTPNDDELARVSLEFAAFDGEVGIGIIPVPDPLAALAVASGRAAQADEGATRLSDGFIIDQDRVRGPLPAATAREHSFGIMDANALLGGFRNEKTRPAETDVARVLHWAASYGPAWDTTWVLNSNTVTLPAKKYDTAGGFDELITDTVEFTGKTLFLHDLADGSGRCLHYHLLTAGHTCGLTISDVAGAEDRVTVFAPWSPNRQRTSVDLVNDVKGRDQAGRTSIATDATSIATHNADGLNHQTLTDFDTTSQADLDVKTAALLASQKDERDTWNCAIGPLDEDALALIRVGDLITVTSSVMGLTASVQRIAHMTLTVTIGQNGRARPGWWNAALELGAPVRRRARVKPTVSGVVIAPGTPGAGIPPPYDPSAVDPNTMAGGTGAGTFSTLDADTRTFDAGVDFNEWQATSLDHLVLVVWLDEATIDAQPAGGWTPHPNNPATIGPTNMYVYYKRALDGADTVTIDWTPACDFAINVIVLENTEDFRGWGADSGSGTAVEFGEIDGLLGASIFVYGFGFTGGLAVSAGEAPGTDLFATSGTFTTNKRPFVAYANHTWPEEFQAIEELGGTLSASVTWVARSIAFTAGSSPVPPSGVPVWDETVGFGDGATTSFTTAFAWVPGSLHVHVDGLDVKIDVATYDPAARTFSLDFAPSGASSSAPAETITVDYVIA